ncbi:MAG: hypothetical protein ACLFNT_05690 [Spirochaetales bacterium]
MRVKRAVILGLLIVAVAVSAAAINPENLNRVTFVNNSGFDMYYLFFSPGDSEQWGADILGTTRTLDDGEKVSFFLHYPDSTNNFDFLAVDEDGDAYLIWDYAITDGEEAVIEITLEQYDGGFSMPDLTTVELTNETGYDLWWIFLSPGDSRMWGVDMLDDETVLETGDTLSLFVPVSSDAARYDFLGVDEDKDTYQFYIEISNARSSYSLPIEISDLQ